MGINDCHTTHTTVVCEERGACEGTIIDDVDEPAVVGYNRVVLCESAPLPFGNGSDLWNLLVPSIDII
jgi:hypothetical protein